ncbi:hypothetical protein ID866_12931 [Astraeus odoratus]|nr:hypothetical protein ID866_12931 [Astraeus odoratus]
MEANQIVSQPDFARLVQALWQHPEYSPEEAARALQQAWETQQRERDEHQPQWGQAELPADKCRPNPPDPQQDSQQAPPDPPVPQPAPPRDLTPVVQSPQPATKAAKMLALNTG